MTTRTLPAVPAPASISPELLKEHSLTAEEYARILSAYVLPAIGSKRIIDASTGLVAKVGKSKGLGDRTVGFIDPGALTMSIPLDSMCETIRRLSAPCRRR